MREVQPCGTEAGYKRHKYYKEEKCQPCKDAHNIYRRAHYNRDLNAVAARKYKEKTNAPKKLKKARKALLIDLYKLIEVKRYEEYLQIKERAKAVGYPPIIITDREPKESREKITERANARRQAQIERSIAIKTKRAIARAEQEEILKQERAERVKKKNQHGVAMGDYDRCRKLNGIACDPCKAYVAKYMREYARKNPEKTREWSRGQNRRRDKRIQANGFEFYNTDDVLRKWGYDCHICNEPIDFKASRQCGDPGWERGLHLDHVWPISKGGADVLENVKPAHAKCNVYKRDLV
jgi:5-methylcytosine-specific restriction endonuclease McrA